MVHVGVGVMIFNNEGKILIGKRKGKQGGLYSIPGGEVELGHTFEETAIREIKEETNLDIINPKVIGITNNLETYKNDDYHCVSVHLVAESYSGELKNMEPHRCEGWDWYDMSDLPTPHFEPSQKGIENYLKERFYNKYE